MGDWLTYKLLLAQLQRPDNCDSGCAVNLPDVDASDSGIEGLLAIVFGAAAAVAILVIVISGFNIITADGEPEKISRGKKSIIFALVGLAIAVSAEFIVLTILDRI